MDDATKTLDVTTEKIAKIQDPQLTRNYGTNDRMLRYNRIDQYFFMDNLVATSKAEKSSRGNSCC